MSSTVFHLDHRSVARITGEEAISFLNRVLTCRLDDLTPDNGRFGALLTPQGKILSDLFVYRTDDALFMDLPEEVAPDIIKRLTLLKLRAKAQFELDENLTVLQSSNPPEIETEASFADSRTSNSVYRSVITKAALNDTIPTAKGHADYESIRIESLLPEFGLDYKASEVFPSDINLDLLSGVDYKKGCFIGQEVVSRMKRKTEVRKRTCLVKSETPFSDTPEPVMAGESTIGEITSHSGKLALSRVRLDRLLTATDKNVPVTVSGNSVSIELPEQR